MGARFRMHMRGAITPPDPPMPSKLSPAVTYNGTPGSGWPGGVGEPVVTVRGAKPQPTVTPLFEDWKTIAGNTILAWNGGGLSFAKFVIDWEGGVAEVTQRTVQTLYDANGNAFTSYAYHSPPLDHASAMALGGAKGRTRLYITAVPADTANFEPRTIMMTIYPRASLWDVTKTIHATPGMGDYTSPQAFYTAARADLGNRWKGVITDSGKQWALGQVSTTNNTEYWTTLTTAPGVTATLGDGSVSQTLVRLDQLHFMGSGIKLDRGQLGYDGGGACLIGRSGSLDRWWFDGCEITCSDFNSVAGNAAGFIGTGSGYQALCNGRQPGAWLAASNVNNPNYFFTEVYFHDIPGDGIYAYRLARNVISDRVSGSTFQASRGATWNCSTSHLGGVDPGLRAWNPAILIGYNYAAPGASAWAGIAKTPTNGNESFPGAISAPGSGYANGSYAKTNLTTLTGTGTGARADIVVTGGMVSACVPDMFGSGYKAGDQLSATLPGGTGFVFTVGGNFSLYEGADKASAVVTNSILIQSTTTLKSVTDQLNAIGGPWSGAWTATNFMSATFLAVNNGVNVPASNIPLEYVPPGGLQTMTIMDIHASASGHTVGGTNVTFWGFSANYNSAASFQAGGGTRRDFLVENCSWIDNGPSNSENGYWKNNTDHHVVVRYCTFMNTGVVFGMPGLGGEAPYYTPTGYNLIDHVAFNVLGAYPSDPKLVRSGLVSLTQTQTSVNSLGWTNSYGYATGAPAVPIYTNSQVYVDPLTDLTPKQATPGFYPLALPDGTIAGRKGLDGQDQMRPGGVAP